jgi:ribosomal protein S18 acetylase RimI-like enzyme
MTAQVADAAVVRGIRVTRFPAHCWQGLGRAAPGVEGELQGEIVPVGSDGPASRDAARLRSAVFVPGCFMTKMSPPRVELRAATPSDAPGVAEIWYRGWQDGHLDSASPELIAARTADSFSTRAAQRVRDTTVAVVDGAVAGFVMVVDDEVEQVYVAAESRGSGVADALLGAAERRIGAAGHASAWLAVVETNARARRFYERRGWIDAGPFVYSAAGDGESDPIPVTALRYVRHLTRRDDSR